MYEKRKAKRLEEKSEITITIVSGGKKSPEEKIMYNQSNDISVLGARIKANIFLPIDTLLKIDFTLKKLQQKITALGKVKWIKIIIEDKYYEAGVEFVNTPSEAIQKLKGYISWKKKTNNSYANLDHI